MVSESNFQTPHKQRGRALLFTCPHFYGVVSIRASGGCSEISYMCRAKRQARTPGVWLWIRVKSSRCAVMCRWTGAADILPVLKAAVSFPLNDCVACRRVSSRRGPKRECAWDHNDRTLSVTSQWLTGRFGVRWSEKSFSPVSKQIKRLIIDYWDQTSWFMFNVIVYFKYCKV